MKSFKDFITERHKGLDWRKTDDGIVARDHRHMKTGGSYFSNPTNNTAAFVPRSLRTKARPFAELSPGGSIVVGNLKAQQIADYFQSNLPLKINEVKRFKSSGYSLTRTQNGFIFKKDSI